jgi:hypothetical protein
VVDAGINAHLALVNGVAELAAVLDGMLAEYEARARGSLASQSSPTQ